MPFIPHTRKDTQEMLEAIGADSIEALFDEIPAELRIDHLHGVPVALTEMEVSRLMRARAAEDGAPLCFIGAGAYEHHIPTAVWDIATRGEYYSAYTPYQAEASQGTLQTIYEYQTMITELTGLDVSNASLYDGASGLAEAALMAVRTNRRVKTGLVLLAPGVNPVYEKVEITESQKEEIFKDIYVLYTGRAIRRVIKEKGIFPQHFPIGFFKISDDKIYFPTYRQKDGKTLFLVYSIPGKKIKEIYLPLKYQSLLLPYPFTIHKETLYQLHDNEEEECWEVIISKVD